jgi:protein-S-isoprenylcysteine O-methyltransferase Ste14
VASASLVSIGLALLLTAGALVRMLCEERLVEQRYPEYREYASKTRRMIPFLF